ncbi:MAG: GxGYxYP family putative glycoside hydrolase [Armatimonadetes bacterium]|nr:GxGYxYP family putative glycoside hydrolase [Armatimonadota bacterium]
MRGLIGLGIVVAGGLFAAGACRAQPLEGLPDAIVRELKGPEDMPQGRYILVQAWQAESAAHKTGRLVDDPEAEGGKAWQVTPGEEKQDTALFGPYIEVDPGYYVAFFRIKLLDELEDDEPVGRVDACVGYGQEFLAAMDLRPSELTPGEYVQVPLGFRYVRGKLECRLEWNGMAALRIDSVSLYRLEGAAEPERRWRVPQPRPTGEPKDLPYLKTERPFPDIFPRSATPARTLVVCDLRKERPDVRLMVFALQGLVNRAQPRIYCLWNQTDEFWLERMQAQGWIDGTEAVAPTDLLARFRQSVKGMVITDPALPATKNIATMLAGVRDGLPVSPRLAKTLDLPLLEDLRGRWKTSAEAYRWAMEELWPAMNHHVLACLWPDHLALRDYLVQHRIFIFWLPGPIDGAQKYSAPDAEVRLVEELLAEAPANIPIMGYSWAGQDVGIGEGPGVTLFAEFAKYLVGSIDVSNLSVHSGLSAELRQPPAPPPPALQDDKIYVSFIISDGDNLPVLTNGNFPQLWADKTRGAFPIGWTLSPSACLLISDVVDYYYRTATSNDFFLGAVSGVGYTYLDHYAKRFRESDRPAVMREFFAQTAEYMGRCDLQDLWIMGATRPELFAAYAEGIPFLRSLFPDYGRAVASYADATFTTARRVPVFRATGVWRMAASREERIAEVAADVRRMSPSQRPGFMHIFVLNWFCDLPMLKEILDRLGPDYVCVRPDHLAQLYAEDMERRQIALRLPAAATCIEDWPLELKVSGVLQNVSGQAREVRLRGAGGLDEALLEPQQASLRPGEEIKLSVTGRPATDKLTIEAAGDFGTRRAEVELRRIPVKEVLVGLPTAGRLVPISYLEAEVLAHLSGSLGHDPAASGGQIWLAHRGQDRPGHIVFGPYQALAKGQYLALFRLKRLSEGTGLVVLLDTCIGGGSPQTGQREVRAEELPEGQWRWVPLVFDHPGGQYETRVLWSGSTDLAVDAVAVWLLEPL